MLESFLLPNAPWWDVLDNYSGWPTVELDKEGTAWSTEYVTEEGDPMYQTAY